MIHFFEKKHASLEPVSRPAPHWRVYSLFSLIFFILQVAAITSAVEGDVNWCFLDSSLVRRRVDGDKRLIMVK